MTNPKLAHATDNGRYYEDPKTGAMYMSVTNALSNIAKPALVPAAVKVTADTAVRRIPEYLAAYRRPVCKPPRVRDECGLCRDCIVKQIKREHRNLWDFKMELGTKVHDHAEARNIGKPMPYDRDVSPFIDQYVDWCDHFGVDLDRDVEFAELTVFHRTLRYAGTADLGVHLHLGPDLQVTPRKRWLWLVDFKTSLDKPADRIYQEQPLQLAGLRYPELLMAPDNSEHPVPEFAGTALLNLRPKEWAFIPTRSGRGAHAAFVHCLNLAYFLHGQDVKQDRPVYIPHFDEKGSAA